MSHPARLPTSAAEEDCADDRERRERNRDGEEDAARPHLEREGQRVREWNLPQPEDEEVDDGRRPSVARAVEALRQNHSEGVEQKSARDDSQTLLAVALHLRPGGGVREDVDNRPREDDE